MTEGSNFRNLWEFTGDTIDVNGITSNDIYVVLQTYGVEAARRTIISEIQGIFASYGIGVDGRHIELIADYMVCQSPSLLSLHLIIPLQRHLMEATKPLIGSVLPPFPRHSSERHTRALLFSYRMLHYMGISIP